MNIAKTFFKTASMLLLAAIMVISGALSYVTQQATTANASSDSLKIKVDNTDVPDQENKKRNNTSQVMHKPFLKLIVPVITENSNSVTPLKSTNSMAKRMATSTTLLCKATQLSISSL